MTNKTKATRERTQQTGAQANVETPIQMELAAEAVLEGWTREQVIDTLISRLRRDRRYLAYRKACNRRTSYDDQVQQDMRALALAATWLANDEAATRLRSHDNRSPRELATGSQISVPQRPSVACAHAAENVGRDRTQEAV